ncbi:response regulator [Anaeroselena agilis]|uniref:Response regulator transcription factor n=1 Tax=Anaeroselena agilis TaxID=3063788 RepID=A0ABU3P2Y5_9FIRM|nr:response regulator transcription factor [Selenomonadales bacterium 4137-cl]
MTGKILIVDDEENIRQLVKYNLEKEGFSCREASDGQACLDIVRRERPDLIVLDIMLPAKDGLEVCRILKSQRATAGIPIIMLTAKAEEVDTILGLEMGADDYITKPFSPRELTARVKAVLRRSQKEPLQADELSAGQVRLNLLRHEAFLGDERLELTPKEYELLKLLLANAGRAFSRDQLLETVWGYEYAGDSRTVDVHIRHLRLKLAGAPDVAQAIETVRGVGYRLAEL